VVFASCGLLVPKSDPVAPPAPTLLGGGGPAGVVDPNAKPELCLLAGVAFACPDGAPEPALPNTPGFWPALVVSASLFGVEKPENSGEGPAFEELLVGSLPRMNSFWPDIPLAPKVLPPPLPCCPPPNDEGFWVFEPNSGFIEAVLGLLLKKFEPEVVGGLLLASKGPLPSGLGVFVEFWANKLLEPSLVVGAPKEKVGTDFGGSDIVVCF
jgi:hypothetical protein